MSTTGQVCSQNPTEVLSARLKNRVAVLDEN